MNAWRALCSTKQKSTSPPPSQVVKTPPDAASEDKPKLHAAAKTEVKSEAKTGAPAPVKAQTTVSSAKSEPSSSSMSTPRHLQRTGDAARDAVREKLKDIFEKGVAENQQYLREQETNTAAMAVETEERMFQTFGGVSKQYKARFRSLVFNLGDPKNPEFIRQVVLGQLHVNDLAVMEVKEMASEEVKKQRTVWQENAKMSKMDEKSYKNYAGKEQEDGILKCPKCKSMKTEYVEVQTRSADEPTTKKCLCNNCDYRWKFC